jgi:hypothetical protein
MTLSGKKPGRRVDIIYTGMGKIGKFSGRFDLRRRHVLP